METKKKIILGVAVVGAAAFIFKDKLFPATASTTKTGSAGGSNHPYEGVVVQREGANGWGRVVDGAVVYYWTDTSWWANGHETPTVLPAAVFDAIPTSKRHYLENGQVSA